jgi:hypothetical protein
VTQVECAAITGEAQPAKGAYVYLEARAIKTKANQDYTRVSWWPCPLLSDGQPDLVKLAAMR